MDEQEIYRAVVPVLMQTEPEHVLNSALDAVMDQSEAERGCLAIPLDSDGKDFAVEFTRGEWPKDPGAQERMVSRSILASVLEKGEAIVLDNALESPDFMHEPSVLGMKLMSVLAVPIWTLPRGPRPVGAIFLADMAKVGAFDEERVAAVQSLIEMLGPRIEQAWRYDQLRTREAGLRATLKERGGEHAPIGASPAFSRVLAAVKQIAASDVPTLLLGESGTGKEVMARLVHEYSKVSDGPFVAINCGALPQELIESELFGHEKGAFTGATSARTGKIASAAGGTLFLDEVGELSSACQTRFLRVLQTGEIQRVGSDRTMTVKVRIVAATNADLAEAIKTGSFRQDLYYRLSVVPVSLPPLRDRGDDVLLLAQKFLSVYSRSSGRVPPRLDPEVRAALLAYRWPGNVRELENTMRRALVFATGDRILLEHLPPELIEGRTQGLLRAPPNLDFSDSLTKDALEAAKKEALRNVEERFMTQVLEDCRGNLSKVARETGLNRAVIYDMLKRLDLDPAEFRSATN